MAHKYKKNEIQIDPIYNSAIVSKFINSLMKKGKKTVAQKVVYGAFEIIKNKEKKEPLEVFEKAIQNASPFVEVRPTRVGGATYQVPREVKGSRQESLAMRWILSAARAKKGKPMKEKLAEELILAFQEQGEAVKKKINVHKMAEANKAFAYLAKRK